MRNLHLWIYLLNFIHLYYNAVVLDCWGSASLAVDLSAAPAVGAARVGERQAGEGDRQRGGEGDRGYGSSAGPQSHSSQHYRYLTGHYILPIYISSYCFWTFLCYKLFCTSL